MTTLSLGYSPCPNDTYIFHALIHGQIPCGELTFTERLEDVETLNQLALQGALLALMAVSLLLAMRQPGAREDQESDARA